MNIYRKYFNKYKIPFFIGILCVCLETVCDLLGPTLMAHILDDGVKNGDNSQTFYYGGLMLLVTFFGALFAVIRNILASRVSQGFGAELRYDLFEKIISFSEESVDRIVSGSLITRMTNDTGQLSMFINGLMRIFFKAPIMCIGSIVLACMINLRLSLILFAVVIIIALFILISLKYSYFFFEKVQLATDKVNSVVQEYLIGIRLIRAFGTGDREVKHFDESNQALMEYSSKAQLIITIFFPLMSLTIGLASVLVIYIGSKMFALEIIDPGKITAFLMYMSQILMSLIILTNVFNAFVRAKISKERIQEVFDADVDFISNGNNAALLGGVRFDDVTFAYPAGSGTPAVSNLSFEIKRGETLAIIGPTGSGKSTIARLMLRFYDTDSGNIFFDDHKIDELDIETVRGSVAFVPQKTSLFSGTVMSNLKWGDENVTLEEMKAVSALASADFVEEMAHEYESVLGSGGVNISGGQKQRLSIARALLKDSPILVLDDATSALDAITEARVRVALTNRAQTVITITQRVTTAMGADNILVMEDGKKRGFGTHKELLKSCEIYRDIYSSQVENINGEGK